MKRLLRLATTLVAASSALLSAVLPTTAAAQSDRGLEMRNARVIEHWTKDRRDAAIPRDLVIDERGLGYIRGRDNQLIPHGHNIAAQAGPAKDITGPAISGMSPAAGSTIGASASFSATVTDASGVRSVSFSVQGPTGQPQSFAATRGAGDTWGVNLNGFTNGAWSYTVIAKDSAKPANTTTSNSIAFTVNTGGGGGGGGGGGTITNSPWTGGGVVQEAAGRIFFEMPDNARRTRWAGYVCSGTVVNDGTAGRSIIITAAHCVYDDANKAFARNVMFIPDQASTTGAGTDRNCANDPMGCWVPKFGVVDLNWTNRVFPDNVAWDYAYYTVNDTGAHTAGFGASVGALDGTVVPMDVSFSAAAAGSVTHALGYSYSMDPQFMYCAEAMENMDAANWFLPSCGLSGGSSGGPWAQPFSVATGNGPIISVNSWGYTTQPGMAGPKLSGTSASCLFSRAKTNTLTATYADGDAGVVVSSCP